MISKDFLRPVMASSRILLSTPSQFSLLGFRSFSSPSSTSSSPYSHHQFSRHLPSALSQFNDFIVSHAAGSWVFGTNGKKYLDFNCGIGVTNLGHCHPKVIESATRQLQKGVHLQTNCLSNQPMIELSKRFGPYLPRSMKDDYQVFLANSGSESVENAVKLSRVATKRQTVIVFQGGFHGRTIGAGALTTAKYVYRAGFQPTMPGVHVVPFPYCSRCPVAAVKPSPSPPSPTQSSPPGCYMTSCCDEPLVQLRQCLKQQTATDEVAAILIEPVLGEGGYIVPPPGFLRAVQTVANEIGALMIADEVQTGFGRTGSMFATETFSFEPDILVVAKGIANGLPLSGIITHSKHMSKARLGSLGGTYGGNPVACAASNAVFDVFEQDKVLDNVKARGEQLRKALKTMQQKYPQAVRDVRGVGLMNAIEFHDTVKGETAGWASMVQKQCLSNGLLVLTAGIHETLRLIPPLNITKEEMDTGIEKLETSIKQVLKL